MPGTQPSTVPGGRWRLLLMADLGPLISRKKGLGLRAAEVCPRHIQPMVAKCLVATIHARFLHCCRSWPDSACLLCRVWCHGGRDHHLCECVRVHCELPACEPTHSHRPSHAPELLTAPRCPSSARLHQLHMTGQEHRSPALSLLCRAAQMACLAMGQPVMG